MNNSSFIIDKINKIFSCTQEILRPFVSASLLLQRFDYFVLLLALVLFIVSLFSGTGLLGGIAMIIIAFTILKLFFIRGQNIEITLPTLVLISFLAICCISIFFSPYIVLSCKGFIKTLIYIGFYFSMVHFFRFNKNKIVPVIFIISFLVTFEAIFAVFQSFGPLEAMATWQDTSYVNAEDMISRVYGTLKPFNPNLLCAYLITGISSIFTVGFWAFFKNHKKTLTYAIISLLITLAAIFLTGCRGGYLGTFAMFLVAFLLINLLSKNYFSQKAQGIWKKLCGSFFALAGLVIVMTPAILKRIMSIFILRKDSSTSFRMNVYQSTWQMFTDNWFSGIGVGNETFRNMYGLYMRTGFDALSAYSIYLEIAVESGIFAFLTIVTFFGMLIKSSWNFINNDFQIEQKVIIISILIMMTGVFVHGFFDTVFFRPQIQFLFWTNIAIMSVILENTQKSEDFITNNIRKFIKGVE